MRSIKDASRVEGQHLLEDKACEQVTNDLFSVDYVGNTKSGEVVGTGHPMRDMWKILEAAIIGYK